jgi:hypothetical protein
MNFIRLTEDENGVSFFEDHAIELTATDFAPPAPLIDISDPETASQFAYLSLPSGWTGKKHPSPRPQVLFCLQGRMRVEAGDGTIREIGAGDIWRMEDTKGSGHVTSVISDADMTCAVVQLG